MLRPLASHTSSAFDRVGRWFERLTEAFAASYLVAATVLSVAAVALVIGLAVSNGSWLILLAALALPAFWLLMWWTG
jgi:hypothetical protein